MDKKTNKNRRNLKTAISCLIIIVMTTTSVSSTGTWQEYEGLGGTYDAPQGMPDFDQRQDAAWEYIPWWDNSSHIYYCGPTSAANALWYLDCLHDNNDQTNYGLIEEAHSPGTVHDLIEDIGNVTWTDLFKITSPVQMKGGLNWIFFKTTS